MSESPTTQEQLEGCTQYLLDRFNYTARMAEVTEELSMTPEALDAALAAFMVDGGLLLRVTLENAARRICERSASALIKAHGDGWREFYEEVSYE